MQSLGNAIKLTRKCRPQRLGGMAKIIQMFLRFII